MQVHNAASHIASPRTDSVFVGQCLTAPLLAVHGELKFELSRRTLWLFSFGKGIDTHTKHIKTHGSMNLNTVFATLCSFMALFTSCCKYLRSAFVTHQRSGATYSCKQIASKVLVRCRLRSKRRDMEGLRPDMVFRPIRGWPPAVVLKVRF